MLKHLRHWLASALVFVLTSGAALALPPGLQNLAGDLQAVPEVVLPALDVAAFKARLNPNTSKRQPFIVAGSILTQLLPAAGRWEPLNNGDRVWRLRISSAQAKSLHLRFDDMFLPPGAELFVYAPDGADVRGPYTATDLTPEGKLWTPVVRGEQLVIELVAPAMAQDQVGFRIASVYYGFEEFWKEDTAQFKEGACHVDVVCPAASGQANIIRSVARIQLDIPGGLLGIGGGTGFCSGQLVNNTANDGKPYFLTANHCISTQAAADSVIAYWNYQKTSCNGPNNGNLGQTQNGSQLLAHSAATDFALIQFDAAPSSSFNVFLSGWDRSAGAPTSAVTIHHPDRREKRISFRNGPLTVTNLPCIDDAVPCTPGAAGSALEVADWDIGATEPGSSGGGLWNAQNRLVGQLSQGNSACSGATDNGGEDWYGRFARSWAGGGTSSSRLSNWLDPGNTSATVIDGKNASGGSVVIPPPAQAVSDDGGGGGCTVARTPPGNGLAALLAVTLLGLWRRRWLRLCALRTRPSFRTR